MPFQREYRPESQPPEVNSYAMAWVVSLLSAFTLGTELERSFYDSGHSHALGLAIAVAGFVIAGRLAENESNNVN